MSGAVSADSREEILADGRTGVFIKQEERARAEVLRATGSTTVLGERAGG